MVFVHKHSIGKSLLFFNQQNDLFPKDLCVDQQWYLEKVIIYLDQVYSKTSLQRKLMIDDAKIFQENKSKISCIVK